MSIPNHPSNRTVIDTMKNWGWVLTKTTGERCQMRWPKTNETITVMAPTYHKGNHSSDFSRIIKITTGGNAELFWARRGTGMTEDEVDQKLRAVDDAIEKLPETFGKIEEDKPLARTAPRGYGRLVLEYLVERNGKPTTAKDVAEALGIPEDSAGSALSYLGQRGKAERIMKGTYLAARHLRPTSTVAHEVTGGHRTTHDGGPISLSVERTKADAAPIEVTATEEPVTAPQRAATAPPAYVHPGAVAAPVAPPVAPVEPPPVAPVVDDNETILVVLDLLFPNGFKAAHLPAIERWTLATKDLLNVVGRP